MHSLRFHYVALGLLIYIQVADVSRPTIASSCSSHFDDIASRTVAADVVFEGRAVRSLPDLPHHPASSSFGASSSGSASGDNSTSFSYVVFRVSRMLKGNLNSSSSSSDLLGVVPPEVVVGRFAAVEKRERCVSKLIKVGTRTSYLVFARRPVVARPSVEADGKSAGWDGEINAVDSGVSSTAVRLQDTTVDPAELEAASRAFYSLTSFPFESNRSATKEVLNNSCAECGQMPVVKLTSKRSKLKRGRKLSMVCRVTAGRPTPRLIWFKNNTVIDTTSPTIKISRLKPSAASTARSSQHPSFELQIKSVDMDDAGLYGCAGENVLGRSTTRTVRISVTSGRPHLRQCSRTERGFCMNGGVCFVVIKLNATLCECVPGFHGLRCEERQSGLDPFEDLGANNARLAMKKRRKRMHVYAHRPPV